MNAIHALSLKAAIATGSTPSAVGQTGKSGAKDNTNTDNTNSGKDNNPFPDLLSAAMQNFNESTASKVKTNPAQTAGSQPPLPGPSGKGDGTNGADDANSSEIPVSRLPLVKLVVMAATLTPRPT